MKIIQKTCLSFLLFLPVIIQTVSTEEVCDRLEYLCNYNTEFQQRIAFCLISFTTSAFYSLAKNDIATAVCVASSFYNANELINIFNGKPTVKEAILAPKSFFSRVFKK